LVEQEFDPDQGSRLTGLRVVVNGKNKRLNPPIQDEIYRIAREAIVNAVRHAKARNIETHINYEPDRLLVAVKVRAEFHDARVVMLTTFQGDVEIQRAFQAGARGYLLKNMPPGELIKVIRQIHAGKKHLPPEVASSLSDQLGGELLTARELEVLRELAGGNRNRDIALKAASMHGVILWILQRSLTLE
jgi:DNA-binding NarL/FixJ family response regulator